MTSYHIAQINVGRTLYPMDDPGIADFVNQLDAINAMADVAPGFVWRLQSDSGNATDIVLTEDPQFIINMSVWESVESLFDYVYKTAHTRVMARRRDWFERPDEAYQCLWWVPAGHIPTPQEGLDRLALLNANGPGPGAFTFKQRFPMPDGAADAAGPLIPEKHCIGWS
ncbi:MAG: DUF3291 domain-containing protein [Rhodospirillales bacterium]